MSHTLSDFIDLTDEQRAVLEAFERDPELCATFYFTGGTLLKALGIVPRLSNDLDFFTFHHVDERTFVVQQERLLKLLKTALGDSAVDITHHGLIHQSGGMIIDCILDAIPPIDEHQLYGNLKVASIKDVAASKASALCSRDEVKDYIDIAFLTKKHGWLLMNLEAYAEQKYKLGTVTEEKLLAELIGKRSQFVIPDEIFLREPEKHKKIVQEQIEVLINTSSL
jgi:predicted nucleotidyltransferase component of viral defense system